MSFDRRLFDKELRKAIGLMSNNESLQLKAWCVNQFGEEFKHVISLAFAQRTYSLETELAG